MDPPSRENSGIYIVWRLYQRRAEVVAMRMGIDLVFLPHRFRTRWLRPLDYVLAFLRTAMILHRRRPPFVVVQTPPVFTALPARLFGIPYLLDAHNATFQSFWGDLPGSGRLIDHAVALIVHNEEVAGIAARKFPSARIVTLRDPVVPFDIAGQRRVPNQVLPIFSFGSDEPVDLLLEVIERAPELDFVLTADPSRLEPSLAATLARLPNVKLTGFLPTRDYQVLLASSSAALVLTTREATQPSGACEALSSNTPLVVSRTRLTETLFGDWAHLVAHDAEEIVRELWAAIESQVDLAEQRRDWNRHVDQALREVLRTAR